MLGAILFIVIHLGMHKKEISKTTQLFFLVLLYSLVFLSLPYWSLTSGAGSVAVSLIVVITGYLLFIVVSYQCTSGLALPRRNDRIDIYFVILFVAAVALNYVPMRNSIGYRGDEGYHITATISYFLIFTDNLSNLYLLLLILMISLWCIAKKNHYYLILVPLCVFTFCVVSHYLQIFPFPHWIKRYPAFFYLLNIPFSIPFSSVLHPHQIFTESNYRLLVLVCTVLIAVYAVSRVESGSGLLKILIGLFVITLPVMHYYSSISYIDMLMILLAVVAVCGFRNGIEKFADTKYLNPTIYCIILLSFVKETAVVYLFVFFLFAAYLIILQKDDSLKDRFILLSRYAIVTLVPLFVFLYFRDVPHNPYQLHINNLFILGNYKILSISMMEQFGLLLPLSVIAVFVLLINKQNFPVVFNLCLIVAFILFYMLNGDIHSTYINDRLHYTGTAYLGYSRFNLALVPSFLTLSLTAANLLKERYAKAAAIVLVLMIIVNQLISPVNSISGVRKPGWGDFSYWTSEYDYPYDEAYRWIADHPEIRNIGVVGRTYTYSDIFYHQKYNLSFQRFGAVKVNNDNIEKTANQFGYILHHREPAFYAKADQNVSRYLSGCRLVEEFTKGDLTLALYQRMDR